MQIQTHVNAFSYSTHKRVFPHTHFHSDIFADTVTNTHTE